MKIEFQVPETAEIMFAELRSDGYIEKGWRRAAYVYAFSEPKRGEKKARHNSGPGNRMSFERFAAAGIEGLRTATSVATHWDNWQEAVDNGWANPVGPGDVVSADLPDDKNWQGVRHGGGLDDGLVATAPIEKKVEVIFELMRRDPEVAARVENAFVQKAAHEPALASRVNSAYEEFHPVPKPPARPATLLGNRGVGSAVYVAVEKFQGDVDEYERVLRERRDEEDEMSVREDIDAFERAIARIRGYEEQLRNAVGIDYDATFERLMGRR